MCPASIGTIVPCPTETRTTRVRQRTLNGLIAELEEQGIDGLVLDLRGNGGGHLTEATALSGLFIDNGPVVQLRNSSGRISRLDDPDPVARVAYNGPLAVLVDRFSASASEIFAAAIQDYARGVIVGQQTFGKGTVQNLYSLDQYLKPEGGPGLRSADPHDRQVLSRYRREHPAPRCRSGHRANRRSSIPKNSARASATVPCPGTRSRLPAFRAGEPLDSTIASLTANQIERSKSDPNFQYLIGRTRDA